MNSPTVEDYRQALQVVSLSERQLQLLRFQYDSPGRTTTATAIAEEMGYQSHSATNLKYGELAKKIGELMDWTIPEDQYRSNYLSTFVKPDDHFRWTMRPELARALEWQQLVDPSRTSVIPEEIEPDEEYAEGAVKTITVNSLERSTAARAACLAKYGYACTVCDIRLSDIYGPVADHFIQVHHLVSLSQSDGEHSVDPVEDLRPVCPNCHAIIHRQRPDHFSIPEVQKMIAEQRRRSSPDLV